MATKQKKAALQSSQVDSQNESLNASEDHLMKVPIYEIIRGKMGFNPEKKMVGIYSVDQLALLSLCRDYKVSKDGKSVKIIASTDLPNGKKYTVVAGLNFNNLDSALDTLEAKLSNPGAKFKKLFKNYSKGSASWKKVVENLKFLIDEFDQTRFGDVSGEVELECDSPGEVADDEQPIQIEDSESSEA